MTTPERLARWRDDAAISQEQYAHLTTLARKERFSLYVELHTLLYLGALAIGAGLLWTVQTYFEKLGDIVIVAGLSGALCASLYYCFTHARPFARDHVASPTHAFDYVLYLSCVVFGILLGYLETRFGALGQRWDLHVLMSAVLFFLAAYRFDNRLVLSLALSTLAAWFGVRISRFAIEAALTLRLLAMAYGGLVAGLGLLLQRADLKRHFFETYLHVAATAIFVALLSGVRASGAGWLYVLALVVAGGGTVVAGMRHRRFAFVAYGVVYPYLGFSIKVMERFSGQAALSYGVCSAGLMVMLMVYLSRRVGRAE